MEGRAYFVYILSAESINQRSFLAATHGTRFALHRSGERIHNFLMFLFCHAKGFYQVAHVAGRREYLIRFGIGTFYTHAGLVAG